MQDLVLNKDFYSIMPSGGSSVGSYTNPSRLAPSHGLSTLTRGLHYSLVTILLVFLLRI